MLGRVGIGHESAFEPGRRTGGFGECHCDQTAGARLGCHRHQAKRLQRSSEGLAGSMDGSIIEGLGEIVHR